MHQIRSGLWPPPDALVRAPFIAGVIFVEAMKYIEDVEDVFDITGRGCVVVPGIPYGFEPAIGKDSVLEFQNPSGTKVRAKIQALEMTNRGRLMNHAPFSLEPMVKKGDIEQGAKMFLVNREE